MDEKVVMDTEEFLARFGSPAEGTALPRRSVGRAMLRGAGKTCPNCGRGRLFSRYLKVNDRCPSCGEELFHHRADDAPPYFTIVIVGHIIVGSMLMLEMTYHPPLLLQAALWLPSALILSLFLLPRVKGALIGLQWALRMHGFGGDDEMAAAAD